MIEKQLTIEVADWEWESLEIWGENREVVGHRVKTGSVIEVQLLLEPRHLIKHWVRSLTQEKKFSVDLEYDVHEALGLRHGSEPVGRLILPLRPKTNLVYLEGKVEKSSRVRSRLDARVELVHSLINCGLPIVLEAEVRTGMPAPVLVSEGQEVIGVCRLFGTVTVSNTMFKAPFNAKVISARTLDTHPPNVLLTIEPTSVDTLVEHRLFYSLLDKKP